MVQWRSKYEHGFRQEIIRVETKCLKEPCFVLVMISTKQWCNELVTKVFEWGHKVPGSNPLATTTLGLIL